MTRVTDRQRVFIEEYLQCWNATEAAQRAGYKNPNKIGPRKLVEVGTQSLIAERISELKASTDEVLTRLASHSRGSMDDIITGESVDLNHVRARGKMHLIKKYEVTTHSDTNGRVTQTCKVELYDAQAATVQLARILGLFIERVEVKHSWQEEARQYGIDPDLSISTFEQVLLGKVLVNDAGDNSE